LFDYCGNGTLASLIKTAGKLPLLLAKVYAAQILSVLAHIHDQNVKHRDLKPENIMLDENYNIRIVSTFPNYLSPLRLTSEMPTSSYLKDKRVLKKTIPRMISSQALSNPEVPSLGPLFM
jgi:serine/threonine protein kinase